MTEKREAEKGEPHRGSGVDAELARPGGLSYLVIPAVDPAQSGAFYKTVVGWRIEQRAPDDLRFTDRTGHLIGRWVTGRAVAREGGLLPYIYVDHVHEAVGLAVAHGGELVEGPREEGDLLVATVRDPAGNLIGLWQERPA
jgi:predicted enzyme related to lactoylglutathione lyase